MRYIADINRVFGIAMVLALPLGLVACAPEEGEELDDAPEVTTPGVEDDSAEPITVDLESVDVNGNDSGVDGEANITRIRDSLMVSLNVENLPGTGPFQAHIHAGTCEAEEDAQEGDAPRTGEPGTTPPAETRPGQPTTGDARAADQGRVLIPLEPVTLGLAGTTGTPGTPGATDRPATEPARPGTATDVDRDESENTGMSNTMVALSQLQGHQQTFIQVHNAGGQPIACGNIDNLDRIMVRGTGGATTPGGTQPTPGAAPGTGANPPGNR